MISLIFYKKKVRNNYIYGFYQHFNYFLGKQTNNSDQGAMPILPRSALPFVARVTKLKINMAPEKFIIEFAILLVKQFYKDKQWQRYQ